MPRGFHLARTCRRDGRLSQQGQRHGPGHSLRPGNTLQPGISRRPGSSAQTDSDRFLPTASSEDSLLAKRLSSTTVNSPGRQRIDVNSKLEPGRGLRCNCGCRLRVNITSPLDDNHSLRSRFILRDRSTIADVQRITAAPRHDELLSRLRR